MRIVKSLFTMALYGAASAAGTLAMFAAVEHFQNPANRAKVKRVIKNITDEFGK